MCDIKPKAPAMGMLERLQNAILHPESLHEDNGNSLRAGMDQIINAPAMGMLDRLQYAILHPESLHVGKGDSLYEDNGHSLRAGQDPRCKIPPKPIPKPPPPIPKPEGHEFTQHFKYRHVDKDACGTYDIIELDTAENLTKMLAPGSEGGNEVKPPNNNKGGGGYSNDLDYEVHLKYRNIDKSLCGELDIQEGEHRDVKKIVLMCYPEPPPPGGCGPEREPSCKR